jgi:hypothetical protein
MSRPAAQEDRDVGVRRELLEQREHRCGADPGADEQQALALGRVRREGP